jgi:hypothetical protein
MAALIANSAKVNVDWNAIGNLPDAYRKGQDWAYRQKMRNVFCDENGGLPRDPTTVAPAGRL